MPQIAQQDYLYLKTPNGFDVVSEWPLSFFEVIEEKYNAGVLYDILLVDDSIPGNPEYSRILSHTMFGGKLSSISFCYDRSVVTFERPE